MHSKFMTLLIATGVSAATLLLLHSPASAQTTNSPTQKKAKPAKKSNKKSVPAEQDPINQPSQSTDAANNSNAQQQSPQPTEEPAPVPAPSADDIIERSYQAVRVQGSLSDATFRLTSGSGQARVQKTFGATKLAQEGNRRVIRFLEPADVRNTTTLLVENVRGDEIWIYLPTLKKARRLASSNKKNSFAGTDLSYGDMLGHRTADWSHKLLSQDANSYLIESTPKSSTIADECGYAKRVSRITRDTFVATRIEFFDLSNVKLKTVDNSDFKLVDPSNRKYQAMTVNVINHQTLHKTQIRFDRFDASNRIDDNYFSTRYIEKEE